MSEARNKILNWEREWNGLEAEDPGILFIAIVTGQPIANVAPIAEMMVSGKDRLLWLQSELAKQANWFAHVHKFFSEDGFKMEQEVMPFNTPNPTDCSVVAQSIHDRIEKPKVVPVLIANGGTKPMYGALVRALERIEAPVHEIFSPADQTCLEWRSPMLPNIEAIFEVSAYSDGGKLKAEHIAMLGGFTFTRGHQREGSKARLLWPDGVALDQDDRYGIDRQITLEAHLESHKYFNAERQQDGGTKLQLDECRKLMGREESPVAAAIINTLNARIKRKKAQNPSLSDLPYGELLNKDDWEEVASSSHSATLNFVEKARYAVTNVKPPKTELGDRFELAVARRVVGWLNQNRSRIASIVAEVWLNAQIEKPKGTDSKKPESLGDFDIAFALKNGKLIVLELKSSFRERGDDTKIRQGLAARFMPLVRSSSNEAEIYVCYPDYSGYSNEEWQKEVNDDFKKYVADWFDHLTFDFPGSAKGVSFEKQLTAIFSRFFDDGPTG